MHYEVHALFSDDTAAEFLRKLTDGTIANQKPDGQEIVAAMNRAVIDDQGVVRWTETCYCSTPLQHERETVYDQHFTAIETVKTDEVGHMPGKPFMEFLQTMAAQP